MVLPLADGNPGPSHAALKGARDAVTVSGIARLSVMNDPTGYQGSVTGVGAGTRALNDKFAYLGTMKSSIPAAHLAAGVDHHGQTASAPGGSTHMQGPPALPLLDEATIAKRQVKVRASIKRLTVTGQTASDALDQLHQIALLPKDRQNPSTRKKRLAILVNWKVLLEEFLAESKKPFVPENEYWTDEMVLYFATTFLRLRVEMTPGMKQAKYVKAVTLRGWHTDLIHAILKYTYDKKTGERAGMAVLVSRGLHDKLEEEVSQLVDDYKLDRTRNPVHYFGRAEIQMMIAQAMKSSRECGRQVRLQIISALLISFYLGTRSSSLAACAKEFRANQKYMKLKHVKIQRVGAMKFIVKLHVTEWKGHNTGAKGKEEYYTLESVVNPHNIIFDVTLWLIAYLWSRKCFGDMTLEDIYKSESSTLDINEAMLEEPLFLKADAGGKRLLNEPTLASYISKSFRHLATEAGLPSGGSACLRRDAANHYGIIMGQQLAALIIGHRGQHHVFTTHYSRNMENIPLVSMRLDELRGDGASEELSKAAMRIHNVFRDAVTALLHIDARMSDEPEQVKKGAKGKGKVKAKKLGGLYDLTQAEKDGINSDLQIVAIDAKVTPLWLELITLFTPRSNYASNKANMTRLFKEGGKFSCTDREAAEKLRQELNGLWALKVNTHRKISLTCRTSKRQEYQEQLTGKTASFDNYKARAAANEAVDRTSDVAQELIFAGIPDSVPQASGSCLPSFQLTGDEVTTFDNSNSEEEQQLITHEQEAELLEVVCPDDDDLEAEQESVELIGAIPPRPDTDDPEALQAWAQELDMVDAIGEEQEDDEQLHRDTKDAWNALPLHFRSAVKKPTWVDHNISPSVPESVPEASVNEEDDHLIDGDVGVGFLDESGEKDVFALPRDLMALYFMQGILAPITDGTTDRNFLDKHKDKKGRYMCSKLDCTFVIKDKERFLAHLAVRHSEWEELLDRMRNPDLTATDRTRWLCPCGCECYERNRTKIIEHCLSSACIDSEANNAKKTAYDCIRIKYPPGPPSTNRKKVKACKPMQNDLSKDLDPSAVSPHAASGSASSSASPSMTKSCSSKQSKIAQACGPAQHESSEVMALSTLVSSIRQDEFIPGHPALDDQLFDERAFGPPPGEWASNEFRATHDAASNMDLPPSFSLSSSPAPVSPSAHMHMLESTPDTSLSDISSVLDPILLLDSSSSSLAVKLPAADPFDSIQHTLDQLQTIGLEGLRQEASEHHVPLPDRFSRVFHLFSMMPHHLDTIQSEPPTMDHIVDELGLVSEDDILHDRIE